MSRSHKGALSRASVISRSLTVHSIALAATPPITPSSSRRSRCHLVPSVCGRAATPAIPTRYPASQNRSTGPNVGTSSAMVQATPCTIRPRAAIRSPMPSSRHARRSACVRDPVAVMKCHAATPSAPVMLITATTDDASAGRVRTSRWPQLSEPHTPAAECGGGDAVPPSLYLGETSQAFIPSIGMRRSEVRGLATSGWLPWDISRVYVGDQHD